MDLHLLIIIIKMEYLLKTNFKSFKMLELFEKEAELIITFWVVYFTYCMRLDF